MFSEELSLEKPNRRVQLLCECRELGNTLKFVIT